MMMEHIDRVQNRATKNSSYKERLIQVKYGARLQDSYMENMTVILRQILSVEYKHGNTR